MNQNDHSDIRQRFLKVDTSNVADVLDEMGFNESRIGAGSRAFC